ncbi:hypothetical protein KC351_g3203 [Hortaea werneckii]|nr:hypothetical protein KC351_g3203 [Hortaea werneckii]
MSSNVPPAATQAADMVINDFYNREDYVRRRAHFLGRHDAYKNVSVFPIARGDAERVFSDEHEVLSVQEVERRETAAEFEDLLPLPTTANTQTMDNFWPYPDQEWTPNSYPVNDRPDPQDTPSPAAAASAPAPRASSGPSGEDTDESEGEVRVSALTHYSINVPVKKQVHFDGPPTPPGRDNSESQEEEEDEEEDEVSPHLEAVIAGTRLPIDRAEALRASEVRRARLGDLQPEFFNQDLPDDGQVRCVCGLTENDGMPMTACEGCSVWQHIACVGPAYYEGMGDYFCQMCEPFVHRLLVARLRRAG